MKKDFSELILETANMITPRLIEHRRIIHSFAETGFDLHKTFEYVRDVIGDFDCKVRKCGRCGLVSPVGKGRAVLLRADMDALPIREETGLNYAAHNGNMHACGHDIHTAMLLGALEIILKIKDKIKGRIVFAFQPAEEILKGAKDMIDDGLLDEEIALAMMLHVMTGSDLPTGTIVIPGGGVGAPSSDFFKINVIGKGAHGASPADGKNALAVAARVLFSIEELASREYSVSDDVTVSVGCFNSGSAPNAIAEYAELQGTIRAYNHKTRKQLVERIKELSNGIASLYGCESKMEITSSCPALVNDGEKADTVASYMNELFGEDYVIKSSGNRGGGSEDFAYIAERVPGVMMAISAGCRDEGHVYPLHNPRTTFSDEVLARGAAALAYSAIRYLDEEQ